MSRWWGVQNLINTVKMVRGMNLDQHLSRWWGVPIVTNICQDDEGYQSWPTFVKMVRGTNLDQHLSKWWGVWILVIICQDGEMYESWPNFDNMMRGKNLDLHLSRLWGVKILNNICQDGEGYESLPTFVRAEDDKIVFMCAMADLKTFFNIFTYDGVFSSNSGNMMQNHQTRFLAVLKAHHKQIYKYYVNITGRGRTIDCILYWCHFFTVR